MANYTDLEADLHIHTISSGHAFSTINEIIVEASKKGLKTIGITDHGPSMPGGAHPYYFANLKIIPEVLSGVRILKGVEANIIDKEGTLDVEDYLLGKLDVVLATFHPRCGYEDRGAKANTETLIKALEKNNIHILAHPGNQMYKLNYDQVARAAKELDVLVEFNNSSYSSKTSRSNGRTLDFQLALACQKYETKVVINSDSHFAPDVGDFAKAWELVFEAGIRKEQILNLDNKKVLNYLEK